MSDTFTFLFCQHNCEKILFSPLYCCPPYYLYLSAIWPPHWPSLSQALYNFRPQDEYQSAQRVIPIARIAGLVQSTFAPEVVIQVRARVIWEDFFLFIFSFILFVGSDELILSDFIRAQRQTVRIAAVVIFCQPIISFLTVCLHCAIHQSPR